MGFIGEMTQDYIGSLEFVREIPRDVAIPGTSDIKAIVGPRRVGKTFTMLKTAKRLLEKGENVSFISADEPTIFRMDHRTLAKELRAEHPSGKIHLFIDEVQEWPEWDRRVRWLHDVKDFDIFVSGSSSALQSSEIPSRLRGRYVSKLILPLSFREIVQAPNGFRSEGRIRRAFRDYIKWGGFPEVWLERSREKILSILETAVYRDAVERHKIGDPDIFKQFFDLVMGRFSSRITYASLRRPFQGIIKDHKTIVKYISAMRSSFIVFLVEKFSRSTKEKVRAPRKLYLVDTSFSSLYPTGRDLGRRLENLVFVEILRRHGLPEYYETAKGDEIDFILKGKNLLIEVCMEFDNEHEKKVLRAMEERKAKIGYILTWDEEDEKAFGRRRIRIMPAWRWILQT